MQLDIISDTICPWCYIGKKRLDRALAERPDLKLDIHWRAFQLDPSVPHEGIDRKTYLTRKFGASGASLFKAVAEAGASDGIKFAFEKIARTPNTLDSHRLIRWAANVDKQDAVVTLLFQRYFEEGQDIGDKDVLLGVADAVGMDRVLVEELLDSDADIDLIQKDDAIARSMGIGGVPCFLVNQKFVLMGAQEPQTLLRIFDRVSGREGTAAT